MRTSPTLRHDALLYGDESEFVEALVPFACDGFARDERVIAVTKDANAAALREALATDAARVTYINAADWYRHPPSTVAKYRKALDDSYAAGVRGVRVIGEVAFGATEERQREWVCYEAALNHAFAGDRAWIVCPYDRRALPPEVLRHAAHTHPHLLEKGRRARSDAYTEPEEVFAELAAPPPGPATPPLADLSVDDDLAALRDVFRGLAADAGLRGQRLEELTLAVNEALTNALTHGRRPVRLRVYRDGVSLLCDVEDAGARMTDLLAGFVPPPAVDQPESGMGLWLARQLCDQVAVGSSDGTTVVRLTKHLASA